MNVLINGATSGTNFGDFLFAKMFQDKLSSLIGADNVFWFKSRYALSEFYQKHLGYNKKYNIKDINSVVFMSGGYFCGDDHSYRDYLLRYLRYFHIGFRAIILKIPYGIFGVEVAIPHNYLIRKVQELILKNAEMVTVRNRESLTCATSLINNTIQMGGVILTADSVFAIERSLFDYYKLPEPLTYRKHKHLFLHINPRMSQNETIISKVIPIVRAFVLNHPEYEIWVGADQFTNEQYEAFLNVKSALQLQKVKFCPYDDPLLLCKILDNADLIITHKLHVGIVGAKLNKSVVSFSGHTEKISRLYNQLNQAGRTHPLSSLSTETGLNMLEQYHNVAIEVPDALVKAAKKNFIELENFISRHRNLR
ncbi:MAG: polysaccharide pyruvyl transferase family protein [Muribaculum sp.]|nr:polysaccharide pyruvyl transferase family protein [Muribaculum sp.]